MWVGLGAFSEFVPAGGTRKFSCFFLLSRLPLFFFLKIFFFDVDHFLSIEFVTILLLF